VKFKLKNEDKYLLAWTTTPWTLPGNAALAVNKALEYVEVSIDGMILILAKKLLETALTDEKHHVLSYEILREFKGEELVGREYEPLFGAGGENAQKIYAAEYVEADAGTGIVHIAPAYGEVDFELAQREKIPVIHVIDDNGIYLPGTAYEGLEVWENNKFIAKDLKEKGVVW
jgi:isoleucyl-tRNA synthetase